MSVRKRVIAKSPVRENRTQGSVGGSPSNGRSYPHKKIFILCCFALSILSIDAAIIQITPFNTAEAVFEPLYNNFYRNATKKDWFLKSGNFRYGYALSYTARVKMGMAVAEFYKIYEDLPLSGYDKLIVYFDHAKGQTVTINIETDKGKISKTQKINDPKGACEFELDLKGSKSLKKLTLKFEKEQYVFGCLYWIGLQNTQKLENEIKYWQDLGKQEWNLLLKPKSYNPEFKLSYNIFFKKGEGEAYREYFKKHPKLLDSVKSFAKIIKKIPQSGTLLSAFESKSPIAMRNWDKKRHSKYDKKYTSRLSYRGGYGAVMGYVLKDKELLRIAARWAIMQCMKKHWGAAGLTSDIAGISRRSIGSFWEDRKLKQLASVLDFAGDMFTPAGKQFVLRQMALKGLGQINYCFWYRSFNYMSNQGLAFSGGRLAAYLIMQKEYKHVERYTKIAIEDVNTTLNNVFAKDGGYLESPGYMNYTNVLMIPIFTFYSNYTGKSSNEIMSKDVLKSANFVDAIASTAHDGYIPIGQGSYCHGKTTFSPDVIAFMAKLLPNSMWVNFWNQVPEKKKKLDVIFKPYNYSLLKGVPTKNVAFKCFNLLKSCALVSSVRKIKDQLVKILFVGFAKDVGKRYNDIGSFVLEFAGDEFAMKLPVYSGFYMSVDFHNMLVPTSNKIERISPMERPSFLWSKPYVKKMAPEATGNEKEFNAKIQLQEKAWNRKYFRKWSRKIDSPTPNEIVITDDYKLGRKATGVNFYWQTALDVKVDKKIITITGKKGIANITVPDDCTVKVEDYTPPAKILNIMGLPNNHKCHKVIIHKEAKLGKIKIRVKLSLKK